MTTPCGGGPSAIRPAVISVVVLPAAPAPTACAQAAAAATPVPAGAPVSTTPAAGVSTAPVVSVPRLRSSWRVVATAAGRPVAWAARRSGVTLMRFDQRATRSELHPGTAEPGGGGWTYPSRISGGETHRMVAGFNAGFKLDYGSLGFMENGRSVVPLKARLASIVTYRDGSTGIGAWGQGVPARGKSIASVRQNLYLLIDQGVPAANLASCVEVCWGTTDGGLTYVARSALGITAAGEPVWAAGMSLEWVRGPLRLCT